MTTFVSCNSSVLAQQASVAASLRKADFAGKNLADGDELGVQRPPLSQSIICAAKSKAEEPVFIRPAAFFDEQADRLDHIKQY